MQMTDQILTTLYADTVAILLLAGVFVLARPRFRQGGEGSRTLWLMFLLSILNAISNGINYAIHYRHFAGAKELAMVTCTITEATVLLLLFGWLTCVDYSLYQSKDHLVRTFKKWFLPIGVFIGLLVVNIPTGIVFSINDEMFYVPHALYRLIEYAEYAYLIASVWILFRYIKMNGNPRFFKMWSFLAPILIGSFVTDFTSYSLRSLGIAIGLVTYFFSTENYRRFLDRPTGFYNTEYMRWLFDRPETKEKYVGAVQITSKADEKLLVPVLQHETPEGAQLIHIDKGVFLLLSDASQKSVLRLLGQVIDDAAYDAGIEVLTKTYLRGREETPEAFAGRLEQAVAPKTDPLSRDHHSEEAPL